MPSGRHASAAAAILLLAPLAAAGLAPATIGGAWLVDKVLDQCAVFGANGLAFDESGTAWFGATRNCTGARVVIGRNDGNGWDHFFVKNYPPDTFGWLPTVALDATGTPHIAFGELVPNAIGTHNDALAYGAWDNDGFLMERVSPIGTSSLQVIDLEIDATGTPHILTTRGEVAIHTRTGPSTWTKDVVSPANVDYAALELDAAGNPHVIVQGNPVMYYRKIGGSWVSESTGGCAGGVELALDSSGEPRVICTWVGGPKGEGMYYLRRTAGTWSTELAAPGRGSFVNIQLDSLGTPMMVYQSFGVTFYGIRTPSGAWATERANLLATDNTAVLALDSNGLPAILVEERNGVDISTDCLVFDACSDDRINLLRPATAHALWVAQSNLL